MSLKTKVDLVLEKLNLIEATTNVQLGEAEARTKEKEKEEEIRDKEKDAKLAEKHKNKKEKFSRKFSACFSESAKDLYSRMHNLEESMKCHGESLDKILKMSETLLAKKEKGE